MDQAADLLLAARRDPSRKLGDLPAALRPASKAAAYAIQQRIAATYDAIGGWKVGAAGPDAPPNCAPMPKSGLHTGPAQLPNNDFTTRDIESEIAFVLRHDLPPRPAPYTRADIIAAIATCHPGLEVVQSRFAEPAAADPLSHLADLIRHGAYVLGPAIPDWQRIDFTHVEICQTIAGTELRRTGNPAGDMLRLIVWLANTGATWAGGLHAGQILTTGSWTGMTSAPPHADVTAHFTGLGRVSLRFS